jgi:hypothetical protein
MKCIFLSLFAILAYTTAMVWEPEQIGYSKADQDGMDRLVSSVLVEQSKHKGKWSGAEQREALRYLWSE